MGLGDFAGWAWVCRTVVWSHNNAYGLQTPLYLDWLILLLGRLRAGDGFLCSGFSSFLGIDEDGLGPGGLCAAFLEGGV